MRQYKQCRLEKPIESGIQYKYLWVGENKAAIGFSVNGFTIVVVYGRSVGFKNTGHMFVD